MKLIFLVEDPIPKTTLLFFVQKPYLDKHGCTYEIWDVRFIAGLPYNEKKLLYCQEEVTIHTFTNRLDFEQKLETEKQSIFVSNFKLRPENLFIYKAFKKRGIRYVIRKNKSHFLTDEAAEIRYLRSMPVRYLINKAYTTFNSLYFANHPGIEAPLITFLGTPLDEKTHNFPARNTRVVYTHALDYERILQVNKNEVTNDSIVFIDQYLPFHPETKKEGIPADAYYGSINRFLLALSQHSGYPVKIAVHPRADLTQTRQYFNSSFVCEINQTNELMKHAAYVVGHMSAALSQAIVLNKKLILITNNSLKHTFINRVNQKLANLFGTALFNIDEPINPELVLKTSAEIDNEGLLHRFIKVKGSPETSEWEIIINALQHD